MPDAGARRKHQMWIAQGHLMAMTDGGTRRACLVPKLKSRIACRSGGRLAATRAHRLGNNRSERDRMNSIRIASSSNSVPEGRVPSQPRYHP
jgi:hypothetical protein